MSDKKWTTRSGKEIQQTGDPSANDIRSLGQARRQGKDRLIVEQRKRAQQAQLRAELTRTAELEDLRDRILGALTGQAARLLLAAAVCAAVIFGAYTALDRFVLSRQLTASSLIGHRARLDARAAWTLGAPAGAPIVVHAKTASTPLRAGLTSRERTSALIAVYVAPRGRERMDGTRMSACRSVVYVLDATASVQRAVSHARQVRTGRCR